MQTNQFPFGPLSNLWPLESLELFSLAQIQMSSWKLQVYFIYQVILTQTSNIDTDGKITEFIIYAIKDLRNAVAHNNTIFDTRFQTSTINNRLVFLLETEVGTTGLDFKYIYTYIVLITYVLRKMGETKTSCKHFITEFIDCTDSLRKQISPNICNQILGTQQRAHLRQLQNFISQS